MNKKQLIEEYEKKFRSSKESFSKYKNCFPKGVCHDIRYFSPFPFITKSGEGIYLTDIDDNKLLDLWIGQYTHILGHANPTIIDAVKNTLSKSTHHGTVNIFQYELAAKIKEALPFIDLLRFCCSGTEATMYAVRLAKSYTERSVIVKIDGGWHGGNSDLSYNIKPPFIKNNNSLSIPFNDIEGSKLVLNENKEKIAAIIVEPVRGSAGAIPGEINYLKFLREYTEKYNIVLIFDETITAFRFCYGSIGVQFGIVPDLITMGKIIGGGFPIGSYGGKKEVMETIENKRLIMGGGTFSANPITMTAGFAMLKMLENKNYSELNQCGEKLKKHINKIITDLEINGFASGYGSLFSLIFLKNTDMNKYRILEPSTFLPFIDEDKNKYFNIITLINNMFTMHNGGALSFLHIEEKTMEQIKSTYTIALNILKSLMDE
jgi:glutamate-1-semialdehyde 2,1-aminomutase